MKKTISLFIAAVLMIFVFTVPVYADSATIALSKSNVTPGTNVTVTVKYNAGFAMYAIDGTLTYNSSVLQYVSGGGANSGSTVKIVEGLSGEKSVSFKIVFKAIAAGSGSLSFSAEASGEGDGKASAGATVTVTETKPSTNANLGSLTISSGTLTPEFKQNTTSYTASVKYTVEKVTISANAVMGDSKVTGAGTFNLAVGDNVNTVKVTSASGATKTYTVTVRRMTEEETAAAEEEERRNNPLIFTENGKYRYIVPDLSGMAQYAGYTLKTVERKGVEISYFTDKSGNYTLFWTTDENGADGAFYNDLSFNTGKNDAAEFKRVNYLQSGDCIYIIEPFKDNITPGDQFVLTTYKIGDRELDCYKYKNDELNGFYVFYCYMNGQNDYYMFDAAQGTVQREPTFLVSMGESDSGGGIFAKIRQLSTQAKLVLFLFVLSGILIIALIVLLIIKAFKPGDRGDSGDGADDYAYPGFTFRQEEQSETARRDTTAGSDEPVTSGKPDPSEFLGDDDF